MPSEQSVSLTRDEYNYLLPVYGAGTSRWRLSNRGESCYFVGTPDDIADMRRRLEGLKW